MEGKYKVCEVKLTYQPKVKSSERAIVCTSGAVYSLLKSFFDPETIQYKESMKIVLLNRANKVLGVCPVSEGGVSETVADVRLIMQAAILANASAVILAHNHPSGNTRPSVQDDSLTEKIKEATRIMNITLLDHLILTEDSYFSYADEGRLI